MTSQVEKVGEGEQLPMILDREEYIEQAYFFRTLGERLRQHATSQEILSMLGEELLATTKLAMALDFLSWELQYTGIFSTAMEKMSHYFTPFQAFVVAEAERESGRFDLQVGLEILEREALYRAEGAETQGLFLYQFESLCRNRLPYDHGLKAVSEDPTYNEVWRNWILKVRRQIGMVNFADLLYVCSEYYPCVQARRGLDVPDDKPLLFSEKVGRIAAANRKKDPLLMFAALHRQLGLPEVPEPKKPDDMSRVVPTLMKRLSRLEGRMKLLEEEKRGGIDITQFYVKKDDVSGEKPSDLSK